MNFDPFAPDVVADPYPHYRRLLDDDEPHYNPERELWVLSRYEHVRAAARAHDVLSSAEGITYARFALPMMITLDPPDHTRLRRVVSRDFTPRAIESWRPIVDGIVDGLVDDLVAEGRADLATAACTPLPIMAIASVMGIPPEDHAEFKKWSDGVVEGFKLADEVSVNAEATERILASIQSLNTYFQALFETRRRHPRDDLLSKLMTPKEGEALSAEELFWFCFLLLIAGNETTTNLLGNLLLALLAEPSQLAGLRRCPELIPSAVEEGLRYDPPLQGFFRTTTAPYRVGGVEIPERARVLLLFAAANHDPRQWTEPDRFDVTRPPGDHLAFGSGIHFCLGAPLARLEAASFLRCLIERTQSIELAGDVVRTRNPTIRGVDHLPVALLPK